MFRVLAAALLVALGRPVEPARPAALAIAEARYQRVGGVDQWITIRGANAGSPVLLFLHGGPGDIQSPLPKVYQPLEQNFVLVQWDQRGAGRTLARAGMQQQASLEQLTRDGIELAEYLRGYLQTTSLTLVGHSWGSTVSDTRSGALRADDARGGIRGGVVTRPFTPAAIDRKEPRLRSGDLTTIQSAHTPGWRNWQTHRT